MVFDIQAVDRLSYRETQPGAPINSALQSQWTVTLNFCAYCRITILWERARSASCCSLQAGL